MKLWPILAALIATAGCGAENSAACATDDDCPLPDVCITGSCTAPCGPDDCAADELCAKRPDPGYARVCQKALDCVPPVFSTTADGCRWTWNCADGARAVDAVLVDAQYNAHEFYCAPAEVRASSASHGSDAPEICDGTAYGEEWNVGVEHCGWLLPNTYPYQL